MEESKIYIDPILFCPCFDFHALLCPFSVHCVLPSVFPFLHVCLPLSASVISRLVDWTLLREDPNVAILFSGAKHLKEWVDEVHGIGYLIAGNYLSISLSPDLGAGNSQ